MMDKVTRFCHAMTSVICEDNRKRTIIILILLINIFKGLLFSVVTPLWQAPDEPFYFAYTRILVEELRIPATNETTAAGHPFLYPLLSTVPYFLGASGGRTAQVFLMRFLGVMLSTLVVWLTFKISYALFPKNPFVQLMSPVLVAFNPQYSFISASVNSDALLVFFSSLMLYLLVKTAISSLTWLRSFWLLAVIGMGLLTKERFSLFFFPLFAILIYELVRTMKSRLTALSQESSPLTSVFTGVLFFIMIKFRSVFLQLTGTNGKLFDPLGPSLLGVPRIPASWSSLKYLFFHQSYSRSFFQRMFEEFWGFFGWLQIPLSPKIYQILAVFCLAALSGLVIAVGKTIIRGTRKIERLDEATWEPYEEPSSAQRLIVLLTFLMTILVAFYAVALYDITTGTPGQGGGQGRYLFPVISPVAMLAAIGISELFPRRAHKGVAITLFFGFFLLNIASLLYFIVPFYYQGVF